MLAITPHSAFAQAQPEFLPVPSEPALTTPPAPPAVEAPTPVAPPVTIIVPTDLAPEAPVEPVAAPVAAQAAPSVSAGTSATPGGTPSAATAPAPTTSSATPDARTPSAVAPVASGETVELATPVAPSPAAEPIPVAAQPLEPFAPLAAESQPAPQSEVGLWALTLGILFVLGLAIWGFMAIGRRKPAVAKAETRTGSPPETLVERRAPVTTPLVREPTPARATPAPSIAHTGAAVALPSRAPTSFAERDELLKRMAAAKPDRANPFRSRKARMRRARLILQSLGRDFGDRQPWIDLSQYSGNWPELARRRHAAA